MAINITKKATSAFNASCKRCGTGFTYQLGDLSKNYQRGGIDIVHCPHCGTAVDHQPQGLR